MKLRQQRVLEWVEFVRDNLGKFSQQLFEQEEFQDCFVLLLEAYIKERAKEKRRVYQEILLNITGKNKEEIEQFELEKFIWTTNQISFAGLNVLTFIKEELLEKTEKDIQKELSQFTDREGVEGKRLEDITRSRIIISDYISKYIYENYNVNSSTLKKKYGYENTPEKKLWHKISYKEHLKEKELMGPLSELANLGILIKKDGTPTFGGTVGSGYSITPFGYDYIAYLDE